MHDIAIIGGGPGGLYAAQCLARQGFDVVVFEEHPAAGQPVHCTGVLAIEAFDEFEVSNDSILNELVTARFFAPSGESVEYSSQRTEAVVVDRRLFDANLCQAAQAAGANIRVGTKINDIHLAADRVAVETAEGLRAEARAVVLACGASYSMQRRLGLGTPSLHLQSAQAEVPADAVGDVEVHFGTDVAPKGFAWAVPVHRREQTFARVGLMCERDARERFDRFMARIAPRWQLRTGDCAPRIKLLPLTSIERTYATRLLAVGDAAGLVKATTGGGIYYSLLSGSLAADVLGKALATDRLDADSLSIYEERWRALLGEELTAQVTLRNLANNLSDADIEALFELAQTDGIMPIVRRTAAFNRHRHLITSLLSHPPARRVLMRRVLGWGRTA